MWFLWARRAVLWSSNSSVSASVSTSGRPKAGRLQGCVLVIDDEDAVREVTSMSLQALGCNVIAAASGEEGIALFQQHQDDIDAVIVDMEMPVLTGEEVFDALLAIDPNVKVVVMSGYSEEAMMDRFSSQKPSAFLPKPHRIFELHAVMKNFLAPAGEG